MKAFYPGTFNPFTNSHMDIVRKASGMFDRVIVGLAHNHDKEVERSESAVVDIANALIDERLTNVNVCYCGAELTAKYALDCGCDVIVRGIGDFTDHEMEQKIADVNRTIAPEITTVYINTSPGLRGTRSSVVRSLMASKFGFLYAREMLPRVIYHRIMYNDMRELFDRSVRWLMHDCGSEEAKHLVENALARYTQSHRHYHNLDHLRYMMDYFSTDSELCHLAILLHDYYVPADPGSSDDDNLCVDSTIKIMYSLVGDRLYSNGAFGDYRDFLAKMIAVTKWNSQPDDEDTRTMKNADWAGFLEPLTVYKTNTYGLVKELTSKLAPKFAYKAVKEGRLQFIDNVKHLEHMKQLVGYNEISRKRLQANIAWERTMWEMDGWQLDKDSDIFNR